MQCVAYTHIHICMQNSSKVNCTDSNCIESNCTDSNEFSHSPSSFHTHYFLVFVPISFTHRDILKADHFLLLSLEQKI